MAIPTYGVVLMSVGIPLFLLLCCCCCAASSQEDDLETGRRRARSVAATPAPPITRRQPVPQPQSISRSQVRQTPTLNNSVPLSVLPNPPDIKENPAPTLVASTSNGARLSSSSGKFESVKLKSYEYEELVAATGGFSNSNLLGEGGFGPVYKGTFPNGDVLAIKKLKYEAGCKENEFKAEIFSISRAHHRHLVKLIGYCSDEANRLIVYEFVPNNSLKSHLHGEDTPIINWANRMKIAIGSAKGLEYLHEGCDPKIIHRDIKADNILLDKRFEPKIADFGLARDISYSVSHISTDPRGTFGYLAPEYANDRKVTDKSDVFSFGVVLLELITGKKHVFFEKNDNMFHNLAVWLMPHIRIALESGHHEDIVDAKLEIENVDQNELARMIHCAAACVYKPARERPNMRQIVEALQGNIGLEHIWTSDDSQFLYDGAPYV